MPTETFAIGTVLEPAHNAGDNLEPSQPPDFLLGLEGIEPETITELVLSVQVTSDPGGGWLPLLIATCNVDGSPAAATWESSVSGVVIGSDYYVKAEAGPTPLGLFAADGVVTITCTPPSPTAMIGGDNDYLSVASLLVGGAGAASATVNVISMAVTYTVPAAEPTAASPPVRPELASPDITTELWDELNTTKVADLEGTWARSWQVQANEVGSGHLELHNDNPQIAELTVGRHVRFKYRGDYAHTLVIGHGDRQKVLAGDGDHAAQITVLESEGHLAEWAYATIQEPTIGNDPPPDRRPFNWAAPEMDISTWAPAFTYLPQLIRQINLDPPYHEPWHTVCRGMNARTSEWIYPINRGGLYVPTTARVCRDLTIGVAGLVTHFVGGDGRVRPYIAGVAQMDWSEQWPKQSFLDAYKFTTHMAAKTHRLGLEIEVYDDLTDRPARGMGTWAAFRELGNGRYDATNLIMVTSAADWRGWEDANKGGVVPAPNPHQIIAKILTEAQNRGMLPGWTLSSTAATDSGGLPWSNPVEFVFQVGASALDALRALAAVSIDFAVNPTGRTVHLFNKGTAGELLGSVAVSAGENAWRLVRAA